MTDKQPEKNLNSGVLFFVCFERGKTRQHGQIIRTEFLVSINQGHTAHAAFIMCPVRGSRITQYITTGHRPRCTAG